MKVVEKKDATIGRLKILIAILAVLMNCARTQDEYREEEIVGIETAASGFDNHSKVNLFFTTISLVTQDDTKRPLHGLSRQNFSITESYTGGTRQAKILRVTPLSDQTPVPEPGESIDIALLLDRSGSMGEDSGNGSSKFERTSKAAIILAQLVFSITDTKQVRVGLLMFPRPGFVSRKIPNSQTFDTLHWYSDVHSIEQVLKQTAPGGGTPLWDSMLEAVSITQSGKGYRAVVALTDGQDNASVTPFEAALKRVDISNIPVFTIFYGIDGPAASHLVQLSHTSGAGGRGTGSYLNADPRILSQIFSNIGGLISDAYEIAYEPTGALAGTTVRVELQITYKTKSGQRYTVTEQQEYVAQ